MTFAGKKVVVVGLARSGAGAARLLADMHAVVTITDSKPEKELSEVVRDLPASVCLFLGGHPEETFLEADLIVISPGVPPGIRPLANARARGKRVIGELELAYQIMEAQWLQGKGNRPFLAVTGSNGKSTTTTLLNTMMVKAGFRTLFGGNIGNALTEEIRKWNRDHAVPDAVVAEISSFQLEAIESFRPGISAILNITPDHLDRYHSMDEYRAAKAGICQNQRETDALVLNADDAETMRLYEERFRGKTGGPQVFFFSRRKEVEGAYMRNGMVCMKVTPPGRKPVNIDLIMTGDIRIKGVHNLENAMAASVMALLANCPVDAIRESLRTFPGLEHRLELVRELEGVRYVNDSKGTNVGAVIKSIESFSEPLILIAGGRDKAGDFSALRSLVGEKVRVLILIGEAAGKIRNVLGDATTTTMAKDLQDAVMIARESAEKGDVVLLSPACASFDMFLDYEDRGRQFKKIVMGLEAVHA